MCTHQHVSLSLSLLPSVSLSFFQHLLLYLSIPMFISPVSKNGLIFHNNALNCLSLLFIVFVIWLLNYLVVPQIESLGIILLLLPFLFKAFHICGDRLILQFSCWQHMSASCSSRNLSEKSKNKQIIYSQQYLYIIYSLRWWLDIKGHYLPTRFRFQYWFFELLCPFVY